MKVYVKPILEIAQLRTDERLAGSCVEVGSCFSTTSAPYFCQEGFTEPRMNQ